MQTGVYIGKDKALQGERALLRLLPDYGKLGAQFDSFTATRNGSVLLAFGWHLFNVAEFKLED